MTFFFPAVRPELRFQREALPQPGTTVRRPDLRVVTPADQLRRRGRAWVFLAASTVCAGLFSVIALRVVLTQGQAEVDLLETRVALERTSLRAVRLTVAQLASPERIVSEARTRLGMVDPPAVVPLVPYPGGATVGDAAADGPRP